MSEVSYRKAISLLRENGLEPVCVKIPTPELVDSLEQRLGVRLPNSYRCMLLEFGLLQVQSIDVSGLGNSGLVGTTSSNVTFATERSREEGLITDTMVEFAVAGYGPLYVFDCAEIDESGEAPIWELPGNGYPNGNSKIADSFGDFLLEEVEQLLAPDSL